MKSTLVLPATSVDKLCPTSTMTTEKRETSPSQELDKPHSALMLNEILEHILQDAITAATTQRFLSTGQHPLDLIPERPEPSVPGSYPSTAGSSYLKVCTQWRDCGYRPLFHTIVLSRQAQLDRLGETLRRNPKLSEYIRVIVTYNSLHFWEGCFDIFQNAQNICTLSLALNLDLITSINGLLAMLPTITPRELILRDVPDIVAGVEAIRPLLPPGYPPVAHLGLWVPDERRLVEKISSCIKKQWKDSLKVLRMAMPSVKGTRHNLIYGALPFATQLREIHLRKSAIVPVLPAIDLDSHMSIDYLKTFRNLEVIILQCHPFSLAQEFLDDSLKFHIDFAPYLPPTGDSELEDKEECYYTGSDW
ncbi:hypothetical protein R3P38DRAFT_3195053 [Favolaschia claudopus]|uniref:Uncharacterized protein n=1 Tax=Favolaschia claudopus TaxID=2862362 RepID=A0AAW0BCZ5_9AGAR